MATSKIAAEIDNVGPNIFIDVVPASQRYGPRNYVRPSYKQCTPPRLYHFKKSNGIPPPDQNPPLKRGDTKPDYKQSAFYKTIKHQRYAQLEARRFRHELSDEVRQTFGDIINDDGTQYGWLDRARANISLVEVRDTLVREQRQNDAGGDTQQHSQQGIGDQAGSEGTPQRQQAMRRDIAINGQRRRQGLQNSRNVRLSLNPVSQRRAQAQGARQVHFTPEQIRREERLTQLATQAPNTPVDGQPSAQPPSNQALSPIQEEAEEQEEGAVDGEATTQATGSAGPDAADLASGDQQTESETTLLATSPPPAARHKHTFTWLDNDDQIRHSEYEGDYANPLERRWHHLERYEARDPGVLTEEETRTSWRTKDLHDLTSPELRLRNNLDMERSWRELQQGRCRFQVEHERNTREHEARLEETRAGRPVTPVRNAAPDVTSAPVTPSRAEPPPEIPNVPARSTYAVPSVEVDSDDDL